jgi:hypothetical protein
VVELLVFYCPQCLAFSLQICSTLELPFDSRSDEISLQILKCAKCGFVGLGVYEESRRGKLDSESIEHRGYILDDSEMSNIEKMIKKCPNPKNSNCKCKVHHSLSTITKEGRWNWLKKAHIKESFKIQRISFC